MSPAATAEPSDACRRSEPYRAGGSLLTRVSTGLRNPRVLALVDQAVVSGTNFATGWALMRLVDEANMGLYTLAMTVVIVGVGMQTELVTNPFKVYGQGKTGNTLRRYTGSAVVHQAFASLGLMAVLLATVLATGNLPKLLPVLPVLAVFGPMIMTREFVRQMSFARFRFDEALVSDILVSGLQLTSLVVLWSLGWLSAGSVLATFGIACGASVLIWLARSKDRIRVDRRIVGRHAVRNWRFARWTLATYLIGSTTPFIMPWVLTWFHGVDAFGLLAACNALIGLSYTFTTGVANWLTAGAAREFHRSGKPGLRAVIRSTSLLLLAGLVPFVIATWFFGGWALTLIYGAKMAGLGLVSFVIACGVMATAANIVAGNALWAIDRPQDGLMADVCVLASTFALAFWLVPPHGIMGAALATAIGVAVGAVVRTASLVAALRRLA